MMLTIGQALDRAQNDGAIIRLNVSGEWITGRVTNTDSQSVVMTDEDGGLCVLRMDAIMCVHLPADIPGQRLPAQPDLLSEAK